MARIGEALRAEQVRVARGIANYPTPIAGCDQQFNALLEQQAGFPAEWAGRVRSNRSEGIPQNPVGRLI